MWAPCGLREGSGSGKAAPETARRVSARRLVSCERASAPLRASRQTSSSDLADQVEPRLEGLLALGPLGRAHLTRMGGDVLGRPHLAQQLLGIAPDAVVVDLAELDLALGVDDERAPQREAGVSPLADEDIEIRRQHLAGVAEQRVLHLLDRRRDVLPGLVGEVRVGRDAVDLDAELLEL